MGGLLRVLVTLLQVALSAGFVLAYAARHVHPRDAWWLQGVALGMPVLVLCMVVVAVGQAALRQPFPLALALVLLVAAAPRYVGWPWGWGGGETLRVLSFNADHAYFGIGDRAALQKTLDAERPDLVALQEVTVGWSREPEGVAAPATLLPLLQDPALRGLRPSEGQGLVLTQLPVFAAAERVSFEELDIAWGSEWPQGAQSAVSRAVLVWDGQPVAVYNVHLRSFGRARPWRRDQRGGLMSPGAWRTALATYRDDFIGRAGDVERLRQLLDEEPYPYVVCGDLNSTPHHWAYGHLLRGGARDAFALRGRGWGGTYHDRLPLVRIDYVLASRHWVVRRAHVPRLVSSDHRPVVAHLALRRDASPASSQAPAP